MVGICLTIDELQVARALCITVAGAVFGASLVGRVLRLATIFIHGDEVQGTIQATAELGQVNIKGELVAQKLERLVLIDAIHQVKTGANVGS